MPMTIIGTILGIALALALSFVFGPTGGLILIGIGFGLVFRTYLRTKIIHEDLQMIKEKLGIEDPMPEPLEEIAPEPSEDTLDEDLKKVNKEIEKELEQYHQEDLNKRRE